MNATVPLLLVATVAAGFVPQSSAQEARRPKPSTRRPVDLSVEGLEDTTRRATGDNAPAVSIGFTARRPTESTLPFDCLESIADQSTGACLTASSSPTFGVLFPYPGVNNVFVAPAFVGGGEENQATGSRSSVGGGYYNTASGDQATIGGGFFNTATYRNATIGGGQYNYALALRATVAGGGENKASGSGSTVGGGEVNAARGRTATISGGYGNGAGGACATVGGGLCSTASGDYATVGGGRDNRVGGEAATIAGGRDNIARGSYSFAAGREAQANHDGSFVWGDGFHQNFPNPSLKTSSADDQFNVYASGGVRMFTNSAANSGVLLAPGGSTWTMVSDRDAKENVVPVDARAVLDKVAELPLSTWNYKDQPDSIRHMGPMAQDFHAAFGLGLGERTIDTIDPNGVALAAIQGLNELVLEKDAEIAELRAANESLLARLERLEAVVRSAMAK